MFPGSKVTNTNATVYNALRDSNTRPGNYIIIAKTVNINKNDFEELIKYIKAGNSVFISCFNFDGFLADTLNLSLNYEKLKGNTILNFTSNQLNRFSGYTFKREIGNQYFNTFDTARAKVIGKNNQGHSTYLSCKFGKGSLFLCANPCIFTNYGVLSKGGDDYVAKALSFLPVTQNIYWDEFQNGDIPGDDSPIRVFFNHPALQWAYYLSLCGMVIFILFEAKRRQRIIPIIEPLKNSTVDFVNVVGQVYYEKRDNTNIAHKKILYLLEHLRETYQIKTNKLDNEFIEKLSTKLGIEPKLATEFVNYIRYLDNQQTIIDRELIELNQLIEQLYSQAT